MDTSQQPQLESFAWAPKAPGLCTIRDLAAGAALALEIVERDDLAAGDEDPRPMLNAQQRADFMRLAITSLQLIVCHADDALAERSEAGVRPDTQLRADA
jgi:hypothetical protein